MGRLIFILLFLPGYLILAFCFFFPTEWGKSRNVSMSGRQWRARRFFAPFHSIWIYFLIWVMWPEIVASFNEAQILETSIGEGDSTDQ